jgi:hypothetical protein
VSGQSGSERECRIIRVAHRVCARLALVPRTIAKVVREQAHDLHTHAQIIFSRLLLKKITLCLPVWWGDRIFLLECLNYLALSLTHSLLLSLSFSPSESLSPSLLLREVVVLGNIC